MSRTDTADSSGRRIDRCDAISLDGFMADDNPTTILRGDRVTHLVYDVSR